VTTALHSAADIAAYLRWMRAKKLSPTSIATAKSVLHGVARVAGVPILDVTRDDMLAWQMSRADQLAPGSLITKISYVRGFYRWALREGLIEVDPSEALEPPRAPRRLPRPIPEDALASALSSADDYLRVILSLAAFGGLRACEIASLDWSEVTLTGRTPCILVVGKGGHERVVDISPPLADALAALPHRHGPVIRRLDGRPGHISPKRASAIANEFLDAHGFPNRLHALRHRFGTAVYGASRDIRATQEALGHASPSTTAIYAAVTRGSVRDAIIAAGELRPDGHAVVRALDPAVDR
jgi:integrase/recombinase XerC